jgi:hypothetical protein
MIILIIGIGVVCKRRRGNSAQPNFIFKVHDKFRDQTSWGNMGIKTIISTDKQNPFVSVQDAHNMVNIDKLLSELTIEEKVSLLAGVDTWCTYPIPRLNIPSAKVRYLTLNRQSTVLLIHLS